MCSLHGATTRTTGAICSMGDILDMLDELTQPGALHIAIIRGPEIGAPMVLMPTKMYENEQRSKAQIQQMRRSHNSKTFKR